MKIRNIRGRALVTGAAALALLVVAADPAAAAPGPASSFGLQVSLTLAGVGVNVGPIPVSSIGNSPNNVLSINVPGVLTTGAVNTLATQDSTTGDLLSDATIADLDLTAGTTLTATTIEANCSATEKGITATTSLVDALLLNAPLASNPAPNTVVNVSPLITATLNEQISNPDGSITVNAIHLRLNVLGLATDDIYLSSASCGPWEAPIPMIEAGPGLAAGLGLLGFYGLGLTGLWWRRNHAALQV